MTPLYDIFLARNAISTRATSFGFALVDHYLAMHELLQRWPVFSLARDELRLTAQCIRIEQVLLLPASEAHRDWDAESERDRYERAIDDFTRDLCATTVAPVTWQPARHRNPWEFDS